MISPRIATSSISPAQLVAASWKLPRHPLAHLPTPLEEVPRFAMDLNGVRVFIKRDDCTGLLLGGNKARHNEFLMGDAVAQGADVVVWGAGVQSNNCRQTAAACAKIGLECRLFLSTPGYSTAVQGNLLLDHLVGAKVQFTDAKIGPELDTLLANEAEKLRAEGRRPYVWHRPRVVPLAAVSYAVCVAEIATQLDGRGITPHAIYVSSAGATGAGVALGAKLMGFNVKVRQIAPMHWPWNIAEASAADANAAAKMLGFDTTLTAPDMDVDESYVAPGYGQPSEAGREALLRLARTEGIMLDPVYSAKAMAALRADCQAGRYPAGSAVVFIHTGGTPAIFADVAKVWP
jgi:L-cysteate sulfo-lyase